MSEQYSQQQPGSMLEIRPTFFFFAFLLFFFKPYFSINGHPPVIGEWKQNSVPVPPGRYQVTVWVSYLFRPQMGLSSITVDVPPGAAAVITWRAPLTIFGTGKIQIAGVGPAQGRPGPPQVQHGAAQQGQLSGPPQQASAQQPAARQPSAQQPSAQQPGGQGQSAQQQSAPSAPAGWHPDPAGRHQVRYFDGARWTEHVSDNNVQARDPLG